MRMKEYSYTALEIKEHTPFITVCHIYMYSVFCEMTCDINYVKQVIVKTPNYTVYCIHQILGSCESLVPVFVVELATSTCNWMINNNS